MFYLVEGTVNVMEAPKKQLSGRKIGQISHDSEWPIFCEMSALFHLKTSCSIVAETFCQIQIIPTTVVYSYLFSEKRIQMGVRFYETICRHYAEKLERKIIQQEIHSSHEKKFLSSTNILKRDSAGGKERRGGLECLSIKDEVVIYTWCFTKRKKLSRNSFGTVALSKSYLAIVWPGDEEETDSNPLSDAICSKTAEIFLLSEIESVIREKKLVKVNTKSKKYQLSMTRQEAKLFGDVLSRILSKRVLFFFF